MGIVLTSRGHVMFSYHGNNTPTNYFIKIKNYRMITTVVNDIIMLLYKTIKLIIVEVIK